METMERMSKRFWLLGFVGLILVALLAACGSNFNSSSVCPNATQPGIAVLQVKSDGTTAQIGSLVLDPNPVALAMDSAGKFLFVAEGINSWGSPSPKPCPQTSAQYGVCVYTIGSDGSLTGVQGTFSFTNGQGFQTPNIVAVAPTPTVFPKAGINGVQGAVCSAAGDSPPTAEYLYAVDADNYVVWEFSVDMTKNTLGNLPSNSPVPSHPTDAIPAGAGV